MRVTFLGTGASHGIPVIGCNCAVCSSENPRDKRLRSSVFIETDNNNLIIDAGPDFRQQVLREQITEIHAVLLTHEHKDHTAGLDDVRAFNYLMKKAMPIYAEDRVLESVKREYSYVFSDYRYPGIPEMDLHEVKNEVFEISGDTITPIRAFHHKLPVFGFRLGAFAYVTDAKTIPEEELSKLTNLDVLVINALRVKSHISHMGIEEAVALIDRLKPKKAYLTHISHRQYDYVQASKVLPEYVSMAYDGLTVEIS